MCIWLLLKGPPHTHTHTQRYWLYLQEWKAESDARSGAWSDGWGRGQRVQTLPQAKFQTVIIGWPSLSKHGAFYFFSGSCMNKITSHIRNRHNVLPPPQRSSRDPAGQISLCWSEQCFYEGRSSWDTQTLPECRMPIPDLQLRRKTDVDAHVNHELKITVHTETFLNLLLTDTDGSAIIEAGWL